MPCHTMSCHVARCHAMSCHVTSCHIVSCYVTTRVTKTSTCNCTANDDSLGLPDRHLARAPRRHSNLACKLAMNGSQATLHLASLPTFRSVPLAIQPFSGCAVKPRAMDGQGELHVHPGLIPDESHAAKDRRVRAGYSATPLLTLMRACS